MLPAAAILDAVDERHFVPINHRCEPGAACDLQRVSGEAEAGDAVVRACNAGRLASAAPGC